MSLRAYQYVPQGPLVDLPPVLGALHGLGAASYPAHLGPAPSRHAPTPMHCKHPGQNTILPANTFILNKLLAYTYVHSKFKIFCFHSLYFQKVNSTPCVSHSYVNSKCYKVTEFTVVIRRYMFYFRAIIHICICRFIFNYIDENVTRNVCVCYSLKHVSGVLYNVCI